MLRETTTYLDPTWGELLDVDVLLSGYWVGLLRSGDAMFVRTQSDCISVDMAIRYPLIRCLEPGRFVIADRWTRADRMNGWLVSSRGGSIREFFAGDGIEDVLASQGTIVITYFDEGVFRGVSPGHEGIAVFDSSGAFRVGYRTALASNAVDIWDCYAACWESASRIVFCPYSDFHFPLVSLDVLTLKQTVRSTPEILHGSSAISTSKDKSLWFSPSYRRNAILSWTPGNNPELLGYHTGRLRGLPGGRFIAISPGGFTIIEEDPDGL